MTDQNPNHRETDRWLEPGKTNLQVIYILYLVAFIVGGLTAIIGVVIAYVNRGRSEAWLETHYTWLIRTFWIGLLYAFISSVLVFVAIGVLLLILVAVWIIIRCVVGLQALGRNEPIQNPQSWIL